MEDTASAKGMGKYNYTEDLLNLEKKHPGVAPTLPITAQKIQTPLNIENWAKALRHHPNQVFVD